jgi:D-lactate dehydrogenase
VDAVELFDRASLRECEADENMTRLVPDLVGADPMAAALLIECRGQDADTLKVRLPACAPPNDSACLMYSAVCTAV